MQRGVYDRVVEGMAARYRALRVGPALADLDLGPLVSERQRRIVEGFLDRAAGLCLAAEGTIVADAPAGGHYCAPRLFADVPPGHPLAQEEIFGPVQVVIPFDDEAEAVAIANGTALRPRRRGLDPRRRAADAAGAERSGPGRCSSTTTAPAAASSCRSAATGRSGHGREKGFEALYGFTRLKTVAARHGV